MEREVLAKTTACAIYIQMNILKWMNGLLQPDCLLNITHNAGMSETKKEKGRFFLFGP